MSVYGPDDQLIPPREAAELLAVNPTTLLRWANAGLIPVVQLPSGHRRYRLADIRRLMQPKLMQP